ncbi:Alpha/beta-Hydrolases superfamily protein [Hibiscus syriacus]|uniref:Alpha/beta-Hydrolases superfamily protein n=1 Tax=Hibiscus syriacus TaxID=106335 RepID=A0A6A2WYJ8_HIBSY|nr:Alpha/beta-Hydrolases superfamily protein [Hibiscus syriacus]
MDAVFQLDDVSRAEYLQLLMHSTGCTYICLWSYSVQANSCLIGFDGCYAQENTQPAALGLFVQYRQSVFPLESDRSLVPGFAFMHNFPYIELGEPRLQNQASDQTQQLFYQRAAFMGCRTGEIELGSSIVVQLNMQTELRRFFPEDFSRQLSHVGNPIPTDPNPNLNRPSSSSSSLRSLSTGSSTPIETSLQPMSSSPLIVYPCQQAMQALTQMQSNIQLPILESENAVITRAILAVITSSTSTDPPQETQKSPYNIQLNPKATAFERYSPTTMLARTSSRAQSLLKRAILFYRMFTFVKSGGQPMRRRPTGNQLQRMMSERRRRERLNEHFNALHSLLPLGTKTDKVSVLTRSREYLTSLKAQIAELSRQNQLLQARLLPAATEASGLSNETSSVLRIPVSESSERLNVRLIPVPESTSEQRMVDLRIGIRGEWTVENFLMRLLEFLKDTNVSLTSIEANTQISELGSVNHVNLRLRIEGNEWDETSFQEAVRRLVADMAQ